MFKVILIAIAATVGAISNANANAVPFKVDAASDVLSERSTENPAAAFATWTGTGCRGNQADQHVPDGGCAHLPGASMQLWWLHDT